MDCVCVFINGCVSFCDFFILFLVLSNPAIKYKSCSDGLPDSIQCIFIVFSQQEGSVVLPFFLRSRDTTPSGSVVSGHTLVITQGLIYTRVQGVSQCLGSSELMPDLGESSCVLEGS